MTKTKGASARNMLSVRTGASPKLLQRKALEKAEAASPPEGEGLEDSFPAVPDGANTQIADGGAEPADTPTDTASPADVVLLDIIESTPPTVEAAPIIAGPAAIVVTPAAPVWTAEDEAAFQALSARRKVAGFKGRGKDVSGQLIRVGDIAPNPDTVVATIVGLVAGRGSVARGELIRLMGQASFSSAKARPSDAGWCQGYVAGALRSGFLTEATEAVVADAAA